MLILVCLAVSASAPPVLAQIRVNPGALDALTPSASNPDAKKAPAKHAAPAKKAKPDHAAKPPAKPSAPKPAPPKPVAVPVKPPPNPDIPPPIDVPVQHPVAPPPVPTVPNAPGEASKIPSGLRVTFGPGRADLNPATEAALRDFARAVKSDERVSANVNAYASGTADDPSTPRRLSLSRALAARAVLISEGIVSTRIYVRALGAAASSEDAPADRVDLTESGATPATPTEAPPP